MNFPEIRTSAFYGRKVEAIREIPSDSEDSELSDDEDEGNLLCKQKNNVFSKYMYLFLCSGDTGP